MSDLADTINEPTVTDKLRAALDSAEKEEWTAVVIMGIGKNGEHLFYEGEMNDMEFLGLAVWGEAMIRKYVTGRDNVVQDSL